MHNENKSAVTTARVAAAVPYEPNKAGNPFLTSPFNLPAFETLASDAVAKDAPEGSYEYRMLKDDAVVPADVETDANAYEVKISWQRNVLHVAHLKAGKSFYVGELEDKKLRCDYFIPFAKLGASRAPVLVGGMAVLPSGAKGTVCLPGKPAMSFAEAIAAGLATPCAELTAAHQVPVTADATVHIQLDDLVIEVRGVKQARKIGAAFTMAAVFSGALLCVLGSFVGHAGLLAAMAAFMPPLGDTMEEEATDEQRYLISQYLESAAEIEKEARPENLTPTESNDGTPGGDGVAAKGASGSMGSESAPERNARWAVKGENPRPYISKTEALKIATDFGMIGILNSGEGSKNEPHAPWAMPTSDGADPLSANGNMWGNEIGDAWGPGGLGLTGIGEGGDGLGEGIGMGPLGTVGHGNGNDCPTCQGFDHGHGTSFLMRGHRPRDVSMRTAPVKLNGRLPPEVIQRVVASNYGRFRGCYQSALASNPNLQGRVVVNFVISRSGTVSSVHGSGDLPNQGVISCVASAFGALTFPQPDGIVTVSYPIVFTPAGAGR